MKNKTVDCFLALCLAIPFMLGFAPVAEAQSNYVIRSGDTLKIEVLEDSGLNRSTLVLPDGSISFPMAGTVPARGRTVEQLRQSLGAALSSNFANTPNIYVSVTSLSKTVARRSSGASRSKIEAYILGEVAAPGLKKVKRGTTILQFLAESGGLTKFAAEKRIELHRTDAKTGTITTYLFNYRTPRGGSSRISGSTKLTTGDVVKIPKRRLFE